MLVSALILAECMGRRCRLLWRPTSNCNCAFHDLFKPSPTLEVAPFWYSKIADLLHATPFKKTRRTAVQTINQQDLGKTNYLIHTDSLERYQSIHFQSCYSDFMPAHLSAEDYDQRVTYYLNKLDPITLLQKRLFALPPSTVGVHVRRTDNKNSIDVSTLDRFIECMKTCLLEQPETTFLLATDDADVESHLHEVFPRKIITFKKWAYDRGQKVAIQEALIDLLLLSKCHKILGSHYSSFSEYASLFHRRELLIVGVGSWHGPAHAIYQRAGTRP